jgi:superfamily II DNA or RNA helicase
VEFGEVADLSDETWLSHPIRAMANPRQAALESWRTGFQYVDERSVDEGHIGLRRPQLGALHAIHAHWSTSKSVATVVMPTGTGKTETMLATMISASCSRILVVVPTDALRAQISDKFLTLGVLKHERTAVLSASMQRPVVGMLTSIPKDLVEIRKFFERCNVVVLTSAIASRCSDEVCKLMAESCSHLFIDEAHHAEAPTWKTFKSRFNDCAVLQFTATPFREDGQPLDGKIIFVYPLRQAQADGYFRPIRFSGVYAYNPLLADNAIAQKVIEELASDATGRHVAMARVSNHLRAKDVFAIYTAMGQYNPVMLRSGMSTKDQATARQKLLDGSARIVVCVDMLGEGFDMPELKIAAFHDLRKSLAVTLQLAGRFTRGATTSAIRCSLQTRRTWTSKKN